MLSAEAKAAQTFGSGVRHPEPPKYFDDHHKLMWKEVIGSKPVDWWHYGNLPLLESYCKVVIQLRVVGELLLHSGCMQEGLHEEKLSCELLAFEKLNRIMIALAQALRLTPQASIERTSNKTSARPAVDTEDEGFGLLGATQIPRTRNDNWFGPS